MHNALLDLEELDGNELGKIRINYEKREGIFFLMMILIGES